MRIHIERAYLINQSIDQSINPIHELSELLGPDKCRALPVLIALLVLVAI
jgi:hypothetical protein